MIGVKLDFLVYHQGESEYRVRGGTQHGALVTVIPMNAKWFDELMKEGSQGPLRKRMLEELKLRAGTVSVQGGVVDWPILLAARARFLSFMRLWPATVSEPLVASAFVNGRWIRVADEEVPGYQLVNQDEVRHAIAMH